MNRVSPAIGLLVLLLAVALLLNAHILRATNPQQQGAEPSVAGSALPPRQQGAEPSVAGSPPPPRPPAAGAPRHRPSLYELYKGIMELPEKEGLGVTAVQAGRIALVFVEYQNTERARAFIEAEMAALLRPGQREHLEKVQERLPLGSAWNLQTMKRRIAGLRAATGAGKVKSKSMPEGWEPGSGEVSYLLPLFLLSFDTLLKTDNPALRPTDEQVEEILALAELELRSCPKVQAYEKLLEVLTVAQEKHILTHADYRVLPREELPGFYRRFEAFITARTEIPADAERAR